MKVFIIVTTAHIRPNLILPHYYYHNHDDDDASRTKFNSGRMRDEALLMTKKFKAVQNGCIIPALAIGRSLVIMKTLHATESLPVLNRKPSIPFQPPRM